MSSHQTNKQAGTTYRGSGLGAPGTTGAAEAYDPLGAPGSTGAYMTTPGASGYDPTEYGTTGGGHTQLHRQGADVETGKRGQGSDRGRTADLRDVTTGAPGFEPIGHGTTGGGHTQLHHQRVDRDTTKSGQGSDRGRTIESSVTTEVPGYDPTEYSTTKGAPGYDPTGYGTTGGGHTQLTQQGVTGTRGQGRGPGRTTDLENVTKGAGLETNTDSSASIIEGYEPGSGVIYAIYQEEITRIPITEDIVQGQLRHGDEHTGGGYDTGNLGNAGLDGRAASSGGYDTGKLGERTHGASGEKGKND